MRSHGRRHLFSRAPDVRPARPGQSTPPSRPRPAGSSMPRVRMRSPPETRSAREAALLCSVSSPCAPSKTRKARLLLAPGGEAGHRQARANHLAPADGLRRPSLRRHQTHASTVGPAFCLPPEGEAGRPSVPPSAPLLASSKPTRLRATHPRSASSSPTQSAPSPFLRQPIPPPVSVTCRHPPHSNQCV